ncbi:MAG: hypothetical protein ABJM29_16030 [Rhizobiaceae bacterium]
MCASMLGSGSTPKISLVALGLLAGCFGGEQISQIPPETTALKQGLGRVAVYRASGFGRTIQSVVKIDGVETGRCKPGKAFFIDTTPGQHRLSAQVDAKTHRDVLVEEGQTTYLKCVVKTGFVYAVPHLVEVEPAIAMPEISKLKLAGRY